MNDVKRRKRGWLRKFLLAAVLGIDSSWAVLYAQETLPERPYLTFSPTDIPVNNVATQAPNNPISQETPAIVTENGSPMGPLSPFWADPISRVPNFFGGFFGRGAQACRNTAQTLTFSGIGAEGGVFTRIDPPFTGPNGPKGPYTLTQSILVNNLVFPNYTLSENAEFTPLVKAKFPGATFINGSGQFSPGPGEGGAIGTFIYNYLFGQNVCVCLPNPSGGGLIGRNLYFENGSPLPQDRVYFFYNHIGNFQGSCGAFDLNRFVFGAEKTFLDNLFSLEVRIPFAGTANSDQFAGQDLSVNHAEFGNVGLALKGVLYRTPNFVTSIGLGFSLPTADNSRMIVGNTPVVEIQNHACLLQPMFGAAWAPNDRCYAQVGLQFDVDPSGNPVKALDAGGGLSRIGTLHDQAYAYLNSAAGCWVYQNPYGANLTGIALQTELNYYGSFGRHDTVQDGTVTVSDQTNRINFLNGTVGTIFRFGERTNLSVAVSFPLAGDYLYNWNVIAQLNYRFGGPR